jgi:hypothetical protein
MRGHHTRRRSSDRSRAGSAALPIAPFVSGNWYESAPLQPYFFRPAFPWQFMLSLAHKSSCGNLADISSAGKAPEDWRTPRRFAYFRNHRVARSVLDFRLRQTSARRGGGSPPLFPEAYQTVPRLTGTAIVKLHRSCWCNGSFFWKQICKQKSHPIHHRVALC